MFQRTNRPACAGAGLLVEGATLHNLAFSLYSLCRLKKLPFCPPLVLVTPGGFFCLVAGEIWIKKDVLYGGGKP